MYLIRQLKNYHYMVSLITTAGTSTSNSIIATEKEFLTDKVGLGSIKFLFMR